MALTVKKITLWRCEVDNRPGALANTLAPLAEAGADVQVLMGYRFPGDESRAAIELFPIASKKMTAAAKAAGLTPSDIPTLLVDGDNRPGLGAATAKAIAEAGINLGFLVVQVVGRRYSAIYGFEREADSRKAAIIIKKVTTGKK